MGKIQIIKSLALPQFTYLASILPGPGEKIIKELTASMFKFLWNGKPDKIKRSVLINTTENGGLKVSHLLSYFNSLKASWVKRLSAPERASWKNLVRYWMSVDLWRYNLDAKSHIIKKINSVFWTEVIKCWSMAAYEKHPEKETKVWDQYLWYNTHIQISGNPVYWRQWDEAGIQQIHHLLKRDGSVLSYVEFKNKFHVNFDFVTFYGLIQSIPKTWLNICKMPDRERQKFKPPLLQQIFETNRHTKLIYDILIQNYASFPLSPMEKWKRDMNTDISKEKWCRIFCAMYKITISSKLRAFLYRFVHRCLRTNTFLFKVGISDTEKCSFCGIEKETFYHLFWECPVTQRFLQHIKTWLHEETGTVINLTQEEILFGTCPQSLSYLNMIFCVSKQIIWRSKIEKQLPSFRNFKNLLHQYIETEYCIAKQNKKLEKHFEKWKHLPLTCFTN